MHVDHIAFENLLDAWNRHQDLREQHAPVVELYHSRARLDEARDDVRQAA